MRSLLVLVLLLVSAAFSSVSGRVLPLTVKEVCLMLRSGYSSEAVQRDLTERHLAEACDPAGEAALRSAGASPSLIDAIKSGAYQTSPADALAAVERQRAQAQRQAAETERLRKMDRLYRTLPPREPTTPQAVETRPVVADLVKGDLVYSRNGSLAPFDQGLEDKKIIALYFSAQWCGPCRKFTPTLVEYYNRVKAQHPEFEIVFMSSDRSAFGMESYMRETQMPWPAVNFGKLASKEALMKYKGDGIPCLVLLDASGKVLAHTYEGGKSLGPEKVLATLDAIFARGSGGQVAQAR
ncbi:MAG TPA: thioredoxin-like domain-containing protein [Chthoniobacterales bacterium]|nr:thioredoxin-like domain-containing protein [Chthoniobacterales bacterium]